MKDDRTIRKIVLEALDATETHYATATMWGAYVTAEFLEEARARDWKLVAAITLHDSNARLVFERRFAVVRKVG